MMTAVPVSTISRIAQPEAETLAARENQRVAELLRSLAPDDWSKPTDCPLWDVRAMAGHVVGAAETFTSLPRVMKAMRAATKEAGDGMVVDAMTARQVRERAELTIDELIARLEAAGPKQARWRSHRALMRHAPMKQPMPDGTVETWKLGYLFDIILTRDPWMHRVDICQATGREMVLTPDHDGRIIADVVAEWAQRHGQPFTLHLTGPAGGTFTAGGGETIELDAVEFCRILSGRATGEGLLTQEVPF
jgi:uncharacterized protein (TIGR03083 family)